MSQGSSNKNERLTFTTTVDLTNREVVVIGDTVGVMGNDRALPAGAANAIAMAWTFQSVVLTSTQIAAGEVWVPGQAIYWNNALQIATMHPTEQFLGDYAPQSGNDKPANATVDGGAAAGERIHLHPRREPGTSMYSIDFATAPAAALLQGDFILTNFGAKTAQIDSATVYTQGDSTLLPGTTTISLGDGTGANDQIDAAAAISTYNGVKATDVTPVNVDVGKIVLRVGVADFTGGWLRIDIRYTLLG
jgi:hypothetical protein